MQGFAEVLMNKEGMDDTSKKQLGRIFSALDKYNLTPDAEITIECNPEDLTQDFAKSVKGIEDASKTSIRANVRSLKLLLISSTCPSVNSIFLPLIFILPQVFGIFGVQLCQPIADICAFLLSIPLGVSELKLMKKQER